MTYLITCSCGKQWRVPECRAHIKHCSVKCLQESRKLDPEKVRRMAAMYRNRSAAAKAIGMPYRTFIGKLKRQGLNGLFLGRGYASNQ